ncbi:hypothetical protein BIV59_04790 [Bacillus sp. MUM 13]|nr:hypothetical protein BIV59_04790 [Bacillus sp. MUM 13]
MRKLILKFDGSCTDTKHDGIYGLVFMLPTKTLWKIDCIKKECSGLFLFYVSNQLAQNNQ